MNLFRMLFILDTIILPIYSYYLFLIFRVWRQILSDVQEYYKKVNGNPLAALLENLK